MTTSNNNNNTDSSQNPPQITTTINSFDDCHTEYSQTVKPILVSSTKTLRIRQDQNVLKRKSKSTVTTHVIDGWIIQESLKPFQQQENKSSSTKKQEQQIFAENSNVHQWSIDEVCSFFEHVLGKNCYTPIIKEHLIDGTALLLLQEGHLSNTFKMPVELRLKLLNRINKLKYGDLSLL
ncbi:unnamed protein product [Rotaria sp. Silwood2]|nr:unnamed protein product [Rotaria sp. Silwood2]CAF2776356.1 unnamed protein product [Rotaria sp. Silwood2]CAF4028772.1 unnamed protein product [Rotaria sp. Silwood2]CAF4225228.1 unnamed protein product [Rotaria sp. Silwood2]